MEEVTAGNFAVWSLMAGAIGGAINSLIAGLINYRKTRDAGQLELVKAEQANQSTKLALLGEQHKACEERHKACEERHAEAVKKMTEAIEKQAELKGELSALKHIVLKDTQATAQLRTEVGVLAQKVEGK